jgi:hypothetical protein
MQVKVIAGLRRRRGNLVGAATRDWQVLSPITAVVLA